MALNLSQQQLDHLELIKKVCNATGDDPLWAGAVALAESSLGLRQKSSTGAKGVFQLTSIMMKDLLQEMEKQDDDVLDILCGIAALHLLFRRYKNIEDATAKFCAPADRTFYIDRVKSFIEELKNV